MDVREDPLEIEVIGYAPTEIEKDEYNELKRRLIEDVANSKTHVVSELIKFVDRLESKQFAVMAYLNNFAFAIDASKYGYAHGGNALIITSNNPKRKFTVYEMLRNPNLTKVVFFSSGVFGADEIELSKTKDALLRHNDLIKLLRAGA